MGRGLADGFAGAGLDGGREESRAEGVAEDDGAELLDGGGACEDGEALGLELGVAGEVVEYGGDVVGVEDVDEGADGQVVPGGEDVELELALEVVVEEGIEEGGGREEGGDVGGEVGRIGTRHAGWGWVGAGGRGGLGGGGSGPRLRVGL